MMMIFGAIGGMKMTGETEVLGENLPQRHFVRHKIPHDQTRSRTPDRSGVNPAINRLSYGAAFFFSPISSPLTTRRITVEVFDPASTWVRPRRKLEDRRVRS
jgi:hypothetical protein